MEHIVVSGAALKKDLTRVTIKGVPDRPGIAAKIFGDIAAANIVVDDIIQNVMDDNTANISFTVEHGDLHDIKPVVDRSIVKELAAKSTASLPRRPGQGQRRRRRHAHPHRRRRSGMFKALADAKVNIQNITTSEIKISCIIDKKDGDKPSNPPRRLRPRQGGGIICSNVSDRSTKDRGHQRRKWGRQNHDRADTCPRDTWDTSVCQR